MDRIILIILLIFPFKLSAGRCLFLLNQNESTFLADASAWNKYFVSIYPNIRVTRLKSYTVQEVGEIIRNYGLNLKSTDSLIIIISSHTLNQTACTILKIHNNEINFDSDVIWPYTYQYWLSYLNEKQINTLVFLLVCHPDEIIPRSFAMKQNSITTVYGSDKGYSIFKNKAGSLMVLTMPGKKLPDMKSYINYLTAEWKKKEYYRGNDINNNWLMMDYYPMKPIMFGPNFYF